MKSKRSKATDFSQKEKRAIIERDMGQCIFCKKKYKMENASPFLLDIKDYMHFIPRSQGGLGIEENGAIGCRYHHDMMDFGRLDVKTEMQTMFEEYLKSRYPRWDKNDLVYDKWNFLK